MDVRTQLQRPCDNCSIRRVKCDKNMPCSRCTNHNLLCTNNREKKKRGPKSLYPKSLSLLNQNRESLMSTKISNNKDNSTDENFKPLIALAEFSPFLQIYQTWYYEIWPVVSVSNLISSISSKTSGELDLNTGNLQSYMLCCALSGAVQGLMDLVSFYDEICIPDGLKSVDFIEECLRARNFSDYKQNPTIDSILTSFFLFVYYDNFKLNFFQSVLYLREAITITELLELHDDSKYKELSREEQYRIRNIYYMLVVTERSTSLMANLPLLLDSATPYTSDIDGRYHRGGFSAIVKLFTLPDKSFFINRANIRSIGDRSISNNLMQEIEEELSNIKIDDNTPEAQKLNIILSQNWMRLLAWNICKTNGLTALSFFDDNFPIKVAWDLLNKTKNLPLYAFETNGRGACTKLVDIAEKINFVINNNNFSIGYDTLLSIFNIISLLKTNIVSNDLRERMHNILKNETTMSLFNKNLTLPNFTPKLVFAKDYSERDVDFGMIEVKHEKEKENAKQIEELENQFNDQGNQVPSPQFWDIDLPQMTSNSPPVPVPWEEINNEFTSTFQDANQDLNNDHSLRINNGQELDNSQSEWASSSNYPENYYFES